MIGRRARPTVEVARGERVLAYSEATDGAVLAGTRAAFYLRDPDGTVTRVPWEQVEAAGWDREESLLTISEVGTWGEERAVHRVEVKDPWRLLQLVRERVTASVVLQRHIPVSAGRGLRVVGRRAPVGDAPVEWFFEYDAGVDPADPLVAQAASAALAQAKGDIDP